MKDEYYTNQEGEYPYYDQDSERVSTESDEPVGVDTVRADRLFRSIEEAGGMESIKGHALLRQIDQTGDFITYPNDLRDLVKEKATQAMLRRLNHPES